MDFRWSLALLLPGLLACGAVEIAPVAADDRPNLILVTIDTLRADALGSYGASGSPTPVLDAIAERGTRFARAYSPAPLTLPSHSSMMTGLQPPAHGVRNNGAYVLAEDAQTLAERLKDEGYDTAAFVSAAVLEKRFGLAQGFDHYDDATSGGEGAFYAERSARDTNARVVEWVDGRGDAARPAFLWIHYFDPHAPYEPPAPFAERFPDAPYTAEVAATDAALGELLEMLDTRGLLARSLLAVTADHGESLGEHGEDTHALTLYDATQHVPLLIAGPTVPRGEVSERLASLVDLAPTLLALLGAPALEAAEGVDLLAQGPDRHAVYLETLATQLDFGWSPLFGARSLTHLYVEAPRPELYADEAQVVNLLDPPTNEHAEVVTPLRRLATTRVEAALPAKRESVDPETRAQLRALGYVVPEKEHAASDVDPKDGVRSLSAYTRAMEALRQGDAAQAREEAELAVRLLPGSARPRVVAIEAILLTGEPRAAIEHARAAVTLSPQWADTHYWFAETATRLGDHALAAKAYGEALRIDPTHERARAALDGSPAR